MGAIILPWVALAGFTGLYQNHSDLILALFPGPGYALSELATLPGAAPQTAATAEARVRALCPAVGTGGTRRVEYLNRDVFRLDAGGETIRIDAATGAAWVSTRYATRLYAPDGALLDRDLRWARILSSLHDRGWVGTRFATWPADITAGALILFGLSGIYVFIAPRLWRMKNRRLRRRAEALALAGLGGAS